MQIKLPTVNMIKRIATKIAGTFLSLKYQFRKKNRAIDIGKQLANVRKILIYMPNKTEQFKVALDSLEKLSKKVPNSKLTLITQIDRIGLIDSRIKADILSYSSTDVNFWGLPKKSLLKFFETSTYDLALDLNPGYDPLSILLFQHSKAPLRVCLDRREKSPFYNFSIRTNANQPLDKRYDTMIQYITVLKQSRVRKRAPSSTSQELH